MTEIRRQYVETTKNNRVVSVDLQGSHAATHLAEQPGLWEITQEAVRRTRVTKPDVAVQVDMGKVVGRMDLVEVRPGEEVVFGRRRNREIYIPFVQRDERPLTRFVVLVLRKLAREQLHGESPDPRLLTPERLRLPQHDLFSAYIGVKTPGLPGGDPKYITEESLPFWRRHALVLGSQEIEEMYDGDGAPPEFRM